MAQERLLSGGLVLRSIRINIESKFSGNHHLLAHRAECFAHKVFVGKWSINFGGIEKCHALFKADESAKSFLFVFCRDPIQSSSPYSRVHRRYLKPPVS